MRGSYIQWMTGVAGLWCALTLAGCEPKADAEGEAPEVAPVAPAKKAEPKSAVDGHEVTVEAMEVTYTANGTTLKGYLTYDRGQTGKRPGVLVVHEWWGHNEYARTRAHMLAKMGYTALALDMYGEGKQAAHPQDAQKFSSQVMGDLVVAEARFEAAMNVLKNHPTVDPEQIAAIGYCFGGGVVLHMARAGKELDAVVSFHGMLAPKTPAKKDTVKAKVLVLHGAADPFVKDETVAAFKKEMEAAGVDYDFVAYPGAKHAFTNPGATELGKKFELPLAYNEQADEKSWAKMEAFLGQVFADATGSKGIEEGAAGPKAEGE